MVISHRLGAMTTLHQRRTERRVKICVSTVGMAHASIVICRRSLGWMGPGRVTPRHNFWISIFILGILVHLTQLTECKFLIEINFTVSEQLKMMKVKADKAKLMSMHCFVWIDTCNFWMTIWHSVTMSVETYKIKTNFKYFKMSNTVSRCQCIRCGYTHPCQSIIPYASITYKLL